MLCTNDNPVKTIPLNRDLRKLQSDIANYWPGMHCAFSEETHASYTLNT